MKKHFKDSRNKVKIVCGVSNTWMFWPRGVGELESVSHGRFKRFQFRAGNRNRNSVPAKDWPSTEFVTKSAGCTTLSDSSSLLFFLSSFFSSEKFLSLGRL